MFHLGQNLSQVIVLYLYYMFVNCYMAYGTWVSMRQMWVL